MKFGDFPDICIISSNKICTIGKILADSGRVSGGGGPRAVAPDHGA
ncbi:hypothetical protein KL939_005179, partial [Ogataea angusta]